MQDRLIVGFAGAITLISRESAAAHPLGSKTIGGSNVSCLYILHGRVFTYDLGVGGLAYYSLLLPWAWRELCEAKNGHG